MIERKVRNIFKAQINPSSGRVYFKTIYAMQQPFRIQEKVGQHFISNSIYGYDKSIVQILLSSGDRQNLSYSAEDDDILPYFAGTIVAIFRTHPFKGNLL